MSSDGQHSPRPQREPRHHRPLARKRNCGFNKNWTIWAHPKPGARMPQRERRPMSDNGFGAIDMSQIYGDILISRTRWLGGKPEHRQLRPPAPRPLHPPRRLQQSLLRPRLHAPRPPPLLRPPRLPRPRVLQPLRPHVRQPLHPLHPLRLPLQPPPLICMPRVRMSILRCLLGKLRYST